MKRLDIDFFLQNTLWVAQNLIGKRIDFNLENGRKYRGIITETEAYFGNDEASHGAKGKTLRNEAMFERGGITYVYLIYGIYHCLNIVTEKEGYASAVLIRGIELVEPEKVNLNGPGKICKYIGLTRLHNKVDICNGDKISLYDIGFNPEYVATSRIGISKNTEAHWRFLLKALDHSHAFWIKDCSV